MIIGIEWGRKSVAYERLWDIADVLGVPVAALLDRGGGGAPAHTLSRGATRDGRRLLRVCLAGTVGLWLRLPLSLTPPRPSVPSGNRIVQIH